MHRESKKETKHHSNKPKKPGVIYEEEMMKKPAQSALDVDRISNEGR